MLSVYIVGCGGIGGYLTDRLPQVISSLSLDVIERTGASIQQYLDNAGNVALPCVADRVVLVDGDTFDARNALRQRRGSGAGGKLQARLTAMRHEMLHTSFLQRMELFGYNAYVTPDNIEQVIPHSVPLNAGNEMNSMADTLLNIGMGRLLATPVVMLAVDNMKTRYEISKYMETFDDCLVLNGGNSISKGHVTVYERRDGEALDPEIYRVYPEVNDTTDKRPDEMHCDEVAPKHDQVAITNAFVADVMMSRFVKWVHDGLDIETPSGVKTRYNEVTVDIDQPSVMALYHPKG